MNQNLPKAMIMLSPNQCPDCSAKDSIFIETDQHQRIRLEDFKNIQRGRLYNCVCTKCGRSYNLEWIKIDNEQIPYPISKADMITKVKYKLNKK